MQKHWLALKDVPEEGADFVLDAEGLWREAWVEFGLPCRQGERPLTAAMTVLPQEEGVLVRGRLSGQVLVPCDRCSEDAPLEVDRSFDEFEDFADAPECEKARGGRRRSHREDATGTDGPDESGESLLCRDGPNLLLDLAGLAWQQFVLALPVKPLCREDCKGLCAACGADLNQGGCACDNDEPDPRMAALRNLKLTK